MKRANEIEEENLRIKATWTWRLTKPLRTIRSWYLKPARRPPLRSSVRGAARVAYHSLPLSDKNKHRLKGVVFTLVSPLLRGTATHRAWRAFQAQHAPRTRPPAVRQLMYLPSAQDPYRWAYGSYVDGASLQIPPADYVALDESGLSPPKSGVKVLAFYLPQFHPSPVNDAAWGAGLHGVDERIQGRSPVSRPLSAAPSRRAGLLRSSRPRRPEAPSRARQAVRPPWILLPLLLVRRPARSGWHRCRVLCGQESRLSVLPLLGERELDAPMGRSGARVLLAQAHSPEDDLAFLDASFRFCWTPRYVRVDGRPVLVVYRPQLLPDAAATARRWREHSRQIGLPDPYLVAAQTFGLEDPTPYGFDAAVEFPPHNMAVTRSRLKSHSSEQAVSGRVYPYPDLVARKVALVQRRRIPRVSFGRARLGQRGAPSGRGARFYRV